MLPIGVYIYIYNFIKDTIRRVLSFISMDSSYKMTL